MGMWWNWNTHQIYVPTESKDAGNKNCVWSADPSYNNEAKEAAVTHGGGRPYIW